MAKASALGNKQNWVVGTREKVMEEPLEGVETEPQNQAPVELEKPGE